MSIINDALKKAEESIQKNTPEENATVNLKPLSRPILLYILILLASLVLGKIIFDLLHHKVKPIKIPKEITISEHPPAPEATSNLPPLEEKKIPEPSAPQNKETFILNGIFFSYNDSYALINNQIVRENDSVDGARVQKISTNSVELNQEGKIITLTTLKVGTP
jgi:type II secretory pathway component PulC